MNIVLPFLISRRLVETDVFFTKERVTLPRLSGGPGGGIQDRKKEVERRF